MTKLVKCYRIIAESVQHPDQWAYYCGQCHRWRSHGATDGNIHREVIECHITTCEFRDGIVLDELGPMPQRYFRKGMRGALRQLTKRSSKKTRKPWWS